MIVRRTERGLPNRNPKGGDLTGDRGRGMVSFGSATDGSGGGGGSGSVDGFPENYRVFFFAAWVCFFVSIGGGGGPRCVLVCVCFAPPLSINLSTERGI